MISRCRIICFYFLYYISVFWFGLTGVLIWWVPYSYRSRYLRQWNRFFVFTARTILNINVDVVGRENMPNYACVIMCKHQSEWEAFYLQALFWPLCTILKNELLRIPFFGWALALMEPIAIDRTSPKEALKQVQNQGLKKLRQGRSVLIFPEGTRMPLGKSGRYARSGATLAIAATVPILPIAHNAGICWPNGNQKKQAGTISFVIGEPIVATGQSARELTKDVEDWIETHSNELLGSSSQQATNRAPSM